MDIKWIRDAGVLEGPFCTAQGAIKQLGDVGVALATIAIAVQTYGIIVGRWSRWTESPYVGLGVICFIWTFISLLVGIAVATHLTHDEPFYGNTEYWCSIRYVPYKKLFIALEYVWLWVALAISFVLYIPVATVVYRQRYLQNEDQSVISSADKHVQKLAVQMIFYPLIYAFSVLPQSIVRFIQFANTDKLPPFEASAFAAITFASSGMLNVLLYSYTRPSLLPNQSGMDETSSIEKINDTRLDDDPSRGVELRQRRAMTVEYNSYTRASSGDRSSIPVFGGLED